MAAPVVADEPAQEDLPVDRADSPTTPAEAEVGPATEIGVLSFKVTPDTRVARYVDDANLRASTLIEVAASKQGSAFTEEERSAQLSGERTLTYYRR
eukprot:7080088-Alexandrium_andersonii.AAC.1